jgi:hypothetical protein
MVRAEERAEITLPIVVHASRLRPIIAGETHAPEAQRENLALAQLLTSMLLTRHPCILAYAAQDLGTGQE